MPDKLVRKMFADYKRTGSLTETARLNARAVPTVHSLLVRRGFLKPRSKAELRITVGRMYWEYISGLSLEDVGDKFGRSRQCVFDMFRVRGLRLRSKQLLPVVEYKGRKYTCSFSRGRHRYLRDTISGRGKKGRTVYLHHVIWEEHNGPVPSGYKVCFIDGNHLNCAIENLELLTQSEQSRKHATGENQFTRSARGRLQTLMRNFESGDETLSAQLKARAA